MEKQKFSELMVKFQRHGNFELSEGEKELWAEIWESKDEDAFAESIGEYLQRRVDSFTPKPPQLKIWYMKALERQNALEANTARFKGCAKSHGKDFSGVYLQAIKKIQAGADKESTMREAWQKVGKNPDQEWNRYAMREAKEGRGNYN